jgi:sulfate-transporting ATPase
MSEFIRFLVLGLGLGATYALTAQGLVVIHRGSGVVNFANAGFGLVGAYAYWELRVGGLPTVLCVIGGLLAAAALGAVAHVLVMRRLWTAAQLTRVIATLGMLALITGLFNIRLENTQIVPPHFLPDDPITLFGRRVGSYDLYLLGIAVVVTAALEVLYRRTTFGLLTTATAENRRSASALGHSPDMVSATNWALGSALAALAAILVAPILSLSVTAIGLLLVPALAAAVMGSFSSFWITFLGAMVVGVAESMVQWADIGTGWPRAVAFVAVIVILLFQGTSLPGRSVTQARLPKVGPGRLDPRLMAGGIAIVLVSLLFVSDGVVAAMIGSAAYGIILLSSVVVTGYAGQLSLAQLSLAGAGAFIGARVAQALGWGFWPALVIAIAGILPVGIVVGIPALRTRGVNLAIVTLGIGVVVNEVVLSNATYTGGLSGTPVIAPSLFGLDLDAQIHPVRYFLLCFVFLVVCAVAVSNLRRSPVGRYLVAVRGNERAAAALGIEVARLKLYAFAVSAVIATIGGMLVAYQAPFVNWGGWDVIAGITLLGALVIAGLGYTGGAIIASLVATAGVIPYLVGLLGTGVSEWVAPVLGLGVILGVMGSPDGAVAQIAAGLAGRRRPGGKAADAVAAAVPDEAEIERLQGHRLELEGLSVSFGGVTALADVSLHVDSGEVVGLIGPNGAGKSTLIDVVTGMTRPRGGSVTLDGRRLDRLTAAVRARAGLARSFQALELFEDLTVRENMLVAADTTPWWGYLRALAFPRAGALPPEALAAVRAFGLEEDLSRYPSELPFGRRRLVGIVRAIAGGAGIVLLDEPAAGLDERESAELARLLRMLADRWGIGILLVEHDMTLVMGVSDRIVALDFGHVIASGPPEEVRTDARVMSAYLGVATADAGADATSRASGEAPKAVNR